jgi:hypothetical protein
VGWRGRIAGGENEAAPGQAVPVTPQDKEVETVDLGPGGASLLCPDGPWGEGEDVVLTVEHPDRSRGSITMAGVVRWVDRPQGREEPTRMGVEFRDLSAGVTAQLLEWLSEVPRVREI